MNSRERRKLEAQQHNDGIDYEKWLLENTRNQTRINAVKMYQQEKAKRALLFGVISSLGISAYVR